MNKIHFFKTIPLLLLMFVLSSCFDITQTITLKDDRYSISFRCGFDKNLMYLAETDEDSLITEFDHIQSVGDDLFTKYDIIDTADEYGLYFSFDCSTNEELTDDLSIFIPEFRNGKLYFPLVLDQEMSNFDTNDSLDMAATMISISKYRLLIGKTLKSNIQSAQLVTDNNKHCVDLEINDYGEMFCINVPIKTLFLSRHPYQYIVVK